MLDDQVSSPAAVAVADPPSTPDSQPAPAAPVSAGPFRFSDIFETAGESEPAPAAVVSNESEKPPATTPSAAQDAKSTSNGVSASDAPAPGTEPELAETPEKALSRREQERQERDQKIAALEAKVGQYEAPDYHQKLRDEILADEAQRASVQQTAAQAQEAAQRFARAVAMPDTDPQLYELVPGTDQTLYTWREEQKELRARYPQAQAALQADADARIAALQADADRKIANGWHAVRRDLSERIAKTAALPNVDPKVFEREGVTWDEMGAHLHAAGAAWKETELADRVTKSDAENARLKQENAELRQQALSGGRAPAVVGRTAGAAPSPDVFDPSRGAGGNLRDAFGFN